MPTFTSRLPPIAFVLLWLATTVVLALPPQKQSAVSAVPRDGSADFDFLHGRWKVVNRRLRQRLAGSNDWVVFDATDEVKALPGGIGNEDFYRTDYWPAFVGITLRFYNPQTQTWSLYWIDNRNSPGILQPPVSGGFSRGVGVFEGDDQFNGKPIKVRYLWKIQDQNHARWEQAFSPDGGQSWETNWTMDFTRL